MEKPSFIELFKKNYTWKMGVFDVSGLIAISLFMELFLTSSFEFNIFHASVTAMVVGGSVGYHRFCKIYDFDMFHIGWNKGSFAVFYGVLIAFSLFYFFNHSVDKTHICYAFLAGIYISLPLSEYHYRKCRSMENIELKGACKKQLHKK